MEVKAPENSSSQTNNESQVIVFAAQKMSKHQPLDVKPTLFRNYLTNGLKNSIYQRYKDAYDDSPTNQSIINGLVNYIMGDGLVNIRKDYKTQEQLTTNQSDLDKYISQEDALLMSQDMETYGGFAYQVIYSLAKEPLRFEYMPIYKLGVGFKEGTNIVDGYWFCWDWNNEFRYRPVKYPKFMGHYQGNDLEICVVRRPTSEPFFPVPDYFPGIPWAEVEGQIANAGRSHFINSVSDITVVNYNNGRMASKELAKKEANTVRENICGTDNESIVLVAFNDDPTQAITVDRVSPPEINQQNVFYAEEAERKIIVAHSVPSILFAGANGGSGFSSNADEIAVATKGLYRRHVNPKRKMICQGLQQGFNLITTEVIKLDFYDFKEEEEITSTPE